MPSHLKLSFSWVGLVVFALPVLINIAYVIPPPVGKAEQGVAVSHWIEYDHFRRGASDRVNPILPLIVGKFSKKSLTGNRSVAIIMVTERLL